MEKKSDLKTNWEQFMSLYEPVQSILKSASFFVDEASVKV